MQSFKKFQPNAKINILCAGPFTYASKATFWCIYVVGFETIQALTLKPRLWRKSRLKDKRVNNDRFFGFKLARRQKNIVFLEA